VLLDVLIAPEFTAVIRSNTQFWNASGLDIEIGWDGVEARTGPLDTIVRGGIQVATPEPAGARASAGDRFELRAEPDEGWQSWSPVLR
jgi:paraquat-inducible protein B